MSLIQKHAPDAMPPPSASSAAFLIGCPGASVGNSPRLAVEARRFAASGRPLALAARLALLLVLVWALPISASDPHAAEEEPSAPLATGEILVAGSVCEAHELRAQATEDASLVIEIPAAFAGKWPSRSACESARLAWDPEAPGPIQPIPFSHKHHAGEFEIDCQYCHSGTDRSPAAGVPSVELCMGCHAQFPKAYDEIEGIRILKQHWEERRPIEWIQIHRLPEHVQFRHNRHIQAGVECQSCHGPVEELDKLYLVPDEHWKYGVPIQKMEMGWCLNCHNDNDGQASVDCTRCHY
ncbi:MAG: cytochrome c3 family protein [Myxococcota bacterium]|nr:cytochrome c3 family protein [Myxococcota bacterium]